MSTLHEVADVFLFRDRARRDLLLGTLLSPQQMPEGAIVRVFDVTVPHAELMASGMLVSRAVLDLLRRNEHVHRIDAIHDHLISSSASILRVTAWRLPRPRTLLNRRASRRTNTRPRWQR